MDRCAATVRNKELYQKLLNENSEMYFPNLDKFENKLKALCAMIFINQLEKSLLKLKYECDRNYIYSMYFINMVSTHINDGYTTYILPTVLDLPLLITYNYLTKKEKAKYRRILTTAKKLN